MVGLRGVERGGGHHLGQQAGVHDILELQVGEPPRLLQATVTDDRRFRQRETQLLAALGITPEQQQAARDRNAFSRLGRFFWRQMTRIR